MKRQRRRPTLRAQCYAMIDTTLAERGLEVTRSKRKQLGDLWLRFYRDGKKILRSRG